MSDLEDLQRQRKEADQRLRRAIDDFDIVTAREIVKEITRLKAQIDQLKSLVMSEQLISRDDLQVGDQVIAIHYRIGPDLVDIVHLVHKRQVTAMGSVMHRTASRRVSFANASFYLAPDDKLFVERDALQD
jgi:hypothetical protein